MNIRKVSIEGLDKDWVAVDELTVWLEDNVNLIVAELGRLKD